MIRADPIVPDAESANELKAYLRLDGTAEDAVILRLIAAAIAHGEAFTGRIFLARGITETVAVARDWRRLAATPVSAITAVTGLGPLGQAVALPPGAYAVDIDAAGDGWVRAMLPGAATRLSVGYQAGLAAGWSALPEALRQGTVRLATHLFTNRDSAEEGPPPAAVAALWRPWRRTRLQ